MTDAATDALTVDVTEIVNVTAIDAEYIIVGNILAS